MNDSTGDELWHHLTIGDRVRVVAWPPEMRRELLHPETLEFYQWLVDTRSILEVTSVDETGLPWGSLTRLMDGKEQYESVILNHGSLEFVR